MTTFDVVDLSRGSSGTRGSSSFDVGHVDTSDLARSLRDIRDELGPLLGETDGKIGLKSIVIKLAVSAEGKIAFIAKGTAEASVEVTFERA